MGGGDDPVLIGSYGLSGGSATVTAEIKYIDDTFTSTIAIAQYSSKNQMKSIQVVNHTGNGIITGLTPFKHSTGDTYKAFWVMPSDNDWGVTPWLPLGSAIELTQGMG